MNLDTRLLVVSCPSRRAIQELWKACHAKHWPDCPFPVDILSPDPDIGWNANLLKYLDTINETYCAVLLDDHFPEESQPGEFTDNMVALLSIMETHPDIGMVKLQAGNAWPPEIDFTECPRLREYDREHHPFKRTNLVPTLFRRVFLQRLTAAVLKECGPDQDVGRNGALRFEVTGTLLTEDAKAWPERMLGIHRPNPDGGGGQSLFRCIDNDGVREGRLKAKEILNQVTDVNSIPGIEAFL